MSVINRVLLSIGVPMYVIQLNTLTGATRTRISDFDEILPDYVVAILKDGTRIQPVDYFGKICTNIGAKKFIKDADNFETKRLENVIKQAYPEMADELL